MDLERLPLHVGQTTDKDKLSLLLPEIEETFPSTILSPPTSSRPSNMEVGMILENPSEEEEEEEEEEVKEEKDEMVTPKKGAGGKKRRRRTQPVKFSDEFSPNPKRPRLRKSCDSSASASASKVPAVRRLKRGSRCGICSGCLRDDCGTCPFCLDKPKFGGPGKKKQRCALRTCSNFEHKSSAHMKREKRMRRNLLHYAEEQDRNGEEENVTESAAEQSKDADSAEMDAPGASTPSTMLVPTTMLAPTHMTIAHDSAQVTIADDAGHVTMLTGPPISVHELAVKAEAKKTANLSDDIMNITTTAPSTLVHDVATEKLASTKKTLASNKVSILDIKDMAERIVHTQQQLIQSTLMEQTVHSSRSAASGTGKTLGISTSISAPLLSLKTKLRGSAFKPAEKAGPTNPASQPAGSNGSNNSKGQAADSLSKKGNSSKGSAIPVSKPADKGNGSVISASKPANKGKAFVISADKGKAFIISAKPHNSSAIPASKPADKVNSSAIPTSKPADKGNSSKGSTIPASKSADSLKGISKAPAISASKKNISLSLGAKAITSPVSTVVVTPYVSPATTNLTPPTPQPRLASEILTKNTPTQRKSHAESQSANKGNFKPEPNLKKMLDSIRIDILHSPNKKIVHSNHMEAPTKIPGSEVKGAKSDTDSSRLETAVSSLGALEGVVKKIKKTLDLEKAPSPKPKVKRTEKASDADIMMCVQCGRERSTSLARTGKFCTQRCIISWMENNPGKTPRDAVVLTKDEPNTSSSSSSSSAGGPPPLIKATPTTLKLHDSPKSSVPRALKNLQIDMAKPGTKLSSSSGMESGSDEEFGSDKEPDTAQRGVVENPSLVSIDPSFRPSLINSLATMITQHQRILSNPMPTGQAAEKPDAVDKSLGHQGVKVPPKGAVKRSVVFPGLAPSGVAKRQKMAAKTSAQGSQKSVSFNLKPSEPAEASSIASSIPSSLEKIASYLQPKKPAVEVAKIKLPPGLPSDIRQWSVSQVVEYFKSTSDCKGYVDLFETQEVDGIALLLLTHETLVKCLGIKLGRTVKIMSRVQELKVYHDHHHMHTTTSSSSK